MSKPGFSRKPSQMTKAKGSLAPRPFPWVLMVATQWDAFWPTLLFSKQCGGATPSHLHVYGYVWPTDKPDRAKGVGLPSRGRISKVRRSVGSLHGRWNATETTFAQPVPESASDVCIVAMGEESSATRREVQALLYSLGVQQRNQSAPIALHVATDKNLDAIVRQSAALHGLQVETVLVEGKVLEGIENHIKSMHVNPEHETGIGGFTKLFLFELFPSVARCVVLDTDVVVSAPLVELLSAWDNESLVLGTWRPTHQLGDKINTGVMVQNFRQMRQKGPAGKTWLESMMGAAQLAKKLSLPDHHKQTGLLEPPFPDQFVLHLVLLVYSGEGYEAEKPTEIFPKGLQVLDVSWNNEMCGGFSGMCETEGIGKVLRLAHFNCGRTLSQPWWNSTGFLGNGKWKTCMHRLIPFLGSAIEFAEGELPTAS
ncbi:unnamed protein product [Amoebophrya sp. A120]|nr:unnamed protein product [Amoebophrya sp. A120]|eukprot:GSA120T00008879001.1